MNTLTARNNEIIQLDNGNKYQVIITEIPPTFGSAAEMQVVLLPVGSTPVFNDSDSGSELFHHYGETLKLLDGDLQLTILK